MVTAWMTSDRVTEKGGATRVTRVTQIQEFAAASCLLVTRDDAGDAGDA